MMHDDSGIHARREEFTPPASLPFAAPSHPPIETSGVGLATPEELLLFRQQFRELAVTADILHSEDLAESKHPRKIGRFEILKEIGSGSYGTVFVALDSLMSRNVAIKVAHLGAHACERLKKRFLKEAHSAARMGHPNVVTVHEYGEHDGMLYIVYQLCIGPTLAEWLAEQPDRIEPTIAAELVRQLAMGLEHAQRHGIIHRDVKPSNVILEKHRRDNGVAVDETLGFLPRLTDFGLAHDRLGTGDLSVNDSLLGTMEFMSPEQVQGYDASRSPSSDLYSLGVIFYRLLTGTLPSVGNNLLDILHQICSVMPPSPRYLNSAVPADLAAICEKCIAKDPGARYVSCEALVKDLENWQNSRPVSARSTPAIERVCQVIKRTPVVCSLAAAIVLVSLASALIVFRMSQQVQSKNSELSRSNVALSKSNEERQRQARIAETAKLEAERQASALLKARQQQLQSNYHAELRHAYQDFAKGQVLNASNTIERMSNELFFETFRPKFDYLVLKSLLQDCTLRLSSNSPGKTAVAAIPGTNLVVTAGIDGKLRFQDSRTGDVEYVHDLGSHNAITSVVVDSQAKRIAYSTSFHLLGQKKTQLLYVRELKLYDSKNWIGEKGDSFFLGATGESVSFSHDSRRIAYAARYQPPQVFDFESRETVTFDCINRHRSLEFSPDGSLLLCLTKEHAVEVQDPTDGREIALIPCSNVPQLAVWTPDRKYIVISELHDTGLNIVEATAPFRHVTRLEQARGSIVDLAISADSSRVVASTRAGAIVCWNIDHVASGFEIKPSLNIVPHAGIVESLCISADNFIVSIDDLGNTLSTPLPPALAKPNTDSPSAMAAYAPEPNHFLAGYPDGSVHIVDSFGVHRMRLHHATGTPVSRIFGSSVGVAVGWLDGRVAFQTSHHLDEWTECSYNYPTDDVTENDILDVMLSEDGSQLAACGRDRRVRMWNTDAPQVPQFEHSFTSVARRVGFTDRQLFCGGMFEEIAVFNRKTGVLEQSLKGTSSTTALLVDQSRKVLVSAHDDGRLRFHSTENLRPLGTALHSIEQIGCLTLSPDQSCYLAGTLFGKLDVWDADDQRIVGTLINYPDRRSIDLIDVVAPDRLLMLSFNSLSTGFQVSANSPLELMSLKNSLNAENAQKR